MVTFVMFNLFVGVVLEAFDNSSEPDLLDPADLDKFVGVWTEFDPEATMFIKVDDLKQFVDDLDEPWGFGKERHASDQEILTKMRETGLWTIPYDDTRDDAKTPYVGIYDVAMKLAAKVHTEKGNGVVPIDKLAINKKTIADL